MVKEVHIAARDRIKKGWKSNKNVKLLQRQLTKKYEIPKSSVNYIIQKFQKTGATENLKGRGQKLDIRFLLPLNMPLSIKV